MCTNLVNYFFSRSASNSPYPMNLKAFMHILSEAFNCQIFNWIKFFIFCILTQLFIKMFHFQKCDKIVIQHQTTEVKIEAHANRRKKENLSTFRSVNRLSSQANKLILECTSNKHDFLVRNMPSNKNAYMKNIFCIFLLVFL